MNTYRIEHGCFFHEHETIKAESESALRDELMRTRPEIFPVQIVKLPELTLEPKYQDTWHQKQERDVPFTCEGGR